MANPFCMWVVCGDWIALVCAPVWFRGDRNCSGRAKEMTLFVPVFSITLCRNAQRSIKMCVMSSLSHRRRTTVLPKKKKINWVTFNAPEAEGEGLPQLVPPPVCAVSRLAGWVMEHSLPYGKHHPGHLCVPAEPWAGKQDTELLSDILWALGIFRSWELLLTFRIFCLPCLCMMSLCQGPNYDFLISLPSFFSTSSSTHYQGHLETIKSCLFGSSCSPLFSGVFDVVKAGLLEIH